MDPPPLPGPQRAHEIPPTATPSASHGEDRLRHREAAAAFDARVDETLRCWAPSTGTRSVCRGSCAHCLCPTNHGQKPPALQRGGGRNCSPLPHHRSPRQPLSGAGKGHAVPGEEQGAVGLAPTSHRARSGSSSRAEGGNGSLPVLTKVGGGPSGSGRARLQACTRALDLGATAHIPPEQVPSPAVRTEHNSGQCARGTQGSVGLWDSSGRADWGYLGRALRGRRARGSGADSPPRREAREQGKDQNIPRGHQGTLQRGCSFISN